MTKQSNLLGTGIDLVEISQLKKAVSRYGDKFLQRIYTERERAYCRDRRNNYEHLSARFAAKEAVRKAFGHYSSGLKWLEVEVENDGGGKPTINLSGQAKALAESIGLKEILVTISHSRRFAVAQALLIGE